MSSQVGGNKPPHEFWSGLEEIVGERALESYDKTQLNQRDVDRLTKGIGAKPEDQRLPMAKYILENCSLNSGMFSRLIGLIGWVDPKNEPELIEAIASHKHFDDEYVYEIHQRSGWMENEGLKTVIERLGMDATRHELLDGVRGVIEAQSPGRIFD